MIFSFDKRLKFCIKIQKFNNFKMNDSSERFKRLEIAFFWFESTFEIFLKTLIKNMKTKTFQISGISKHNKYH